MHHDRRSTEIGTSDDPGCMRLKRATMSAMASLGEGEPLTGPTQNKMGVFQDRNGLTNNEKNGPQCAHESVGEAYVETREAVKYVDVTLDSELTGSVLSYCRARDAFPLVDGGDNVLRCTDVDRRTSPRHIQKAIISVQGRGSWA